MPGPTLPTFQPAVFQGTVFGGTFGEPSLRVFVDWTNKGTFDKAAPVPAFQPAVFQGTVFGGVTGDEVTADLTTGTGVAWERGRNADHSGDATGEATFTLNNVGATLATPGKYSLMADLTPGRAVLIQSDWGISRAHFYGFIERVSPNHRDFTVAVTCYDPLRRLGETSIVVPSQQGTVRQMRVGISDDFARGDRNLLANPSFALGSASWQFSGGTLSAVPPGFAGDLPPDPLVTNAIDLTVTGSTGHLFQFPQMIPQTLLSQPYTFSVYLRRISGSGSIHVGVGNDLVTLFTLRTVDLSDGAWQRATVTWESLSTNKVSQFSPGPVRPFVRVLGTGTTVRVAGAQFTRGAETHPYHPTGTGRAPSWVLGGSFEGSSSTGWAQAWTNRCPNPSFEVDTAGWSVAGDAFVGPATSIVRVSDVTQAVYGRGRGVLTTPATAGVGVFIPLPGVFRAGIAHSVQVVVRQVGGTFVKPGIGSNGTPADFAEYAPNVSPATYTKLTLTWNPSADRDDVHLYVKSALASAGTIDIDGVMVSDTVLAFPPYADTGPGGGARSHASRTTKQKFAADFGPAGFQPYGDGYLEVVASADPSSGVIYDLQHGGGVFVKGQPYVLSASLAAVQLPVFQAAVFQPSVFGVLPATGSIAVRVGLGASNGRGGFDERFLDATIPRDGAFHQVTVIWTPEADRNPDQTGAGQSATYNASAFIYSLTPNATVQVEGVRLIPGSEPDAFELAHWILPSEADALRSTASIAGTALGALGTLNGITLTRHYIRPTLAAPYYEYVASPRFQLPFKALAESFGQAFDGFADGDLDRAAIINMLIVRVASVAEYFSDPDPVRLRKTGPRPGADINAIAFFEGFAIADAIAQAVFVRYATARARPTIGRVNRNLVNLGSIIRREVDDLITLTLDRAAITAREYVIVKSTVTVKGLEWRASWGLEEYPDFA